MTPATAPAPATERVIRTVSARYQHYFMRSALPAGLALARDKATAYLVKWLALLLGDDLVLSQILVHRNPLVRVRIVLLEDVPVVLNLLLRQLFLDDGLALRRGQRAARESEHEEAARDHNPSSPSAQHHASHRKQAPASRPSPQPRLPLTSGACDSLVIARPRSSFSFFYCF